MVRGIIPEENMRKAREILARIKEKEMSKELVPIEVFILQRSLLSPEKKLEIEKHWTQEYKKDGYKPIFIYRISVDEEFTLYDQGE